MAQTRPCDVRPNGDQDKYSIALMDRGGRWWGLDVPLPQIYPSTANPPPPLERVYLNSFHAGRGFDKFIPDQFGFYQSYNGWSTTPGKYHATLLQKWGRGLRNVDFNMPDANGVTWKPLVGSTKYLSVSFVASASYNAEKIVLLIRKKVPAGTVGAPGTLTVELRENAGGNPGTLMQTVAITADDVADVISEYYEFDLSPEAIANATTYHVVVYGDTGDKKESCWEIGCDIGAAGKRSDNGSSWTATTFSPYFRVTDADPLRQYKPFVLDGALYLTAIYDDGVTNSKLYLNGNRGRATGTQTSTTLQDTTHGAYGATVLPTDRFKDAFIRITKGTGRGQVRQITANNGDTYTVSPAWGITPVSGSSEYVVYACDWFVEITPTGFGVVTGNPIIQNKIVYFPQGDGVAIRKMQINYADADVHEFGSETATNQNKAYFLETGFDTAKGEPNIWRANQFDTSGSTPNAKAISVSRASSAPNRTPVAFSADLLFAESVLTGDNTNLITNIHFHENTLYVFKEDGLYIVQNDQAALVRLGVETAPDVDNGRTAVTAGDKQLYIAFRNDVYLISGGGAYSTGLKVNMPSNLTGPVVDLEAAEGWVFAAINGGNNNYSSVMMFALDTKTWREHLRSYALGRRIRNVQWQNCPETRPRLWIDVGGEMMYQEFPISGVRPYDDKEIKYQHETVIELPTIDLGTTDPKYFAVLTVTSQGLASEGDTESGHVIVVECQTDNDIGTNKWEHVDYIKVSPTAQVEMARGSKRMIRPRLRLISNEAADPVIVETIGLSLFTRNRLAHEWTMQFPIRGDDEEQNSTDLLMALREMYAKAESLTMYSRFTLFDNRKVTLADEPKYQVEELDQPNNELEAQIWLKLMEVI
jgi:hypothetical protein